jgi:hypothetical protein
MWQSGHLGSFSFLFFYFFLKKRSKSCHVNKGNKELRLEMTIHHIYTLPFKDTTLDHICQRGNFSFKKKKNLKAS